jgi:outer membrane lipoprotein-sorting protein
VRSSSASRVELGAALVAIALALAAIATRAEAQAPSLDQLLARFREVPGMQCRFHEEKRIALLTTPIVSEGTVHYARPGRLARRITSPSPQVVLIDGGQLRMSEGGRVETIDLAAQPVVRSFVDTFSLLFSGERAALERTYRITYVPGEGSRWTLVLVPRVSPLDRFLREIRFEGDGTSLGRMVMTEVSGDVTTTTFSDVDVARRFSTDEAARIFSLR